MKIGCPKEILDKEYRVGLTPEAVKAYVKAGNVVFIENNAGVMSGFKNKEYTDAGATILADASDVWNKSDMIVKVKQPLKSEYKYFRENLVIYTYFHLASNEELLKELMKKKVISIAYETIQLDDRSLPCLEPMSDIAGRLATLEGSRYLQSNNKGQGVLISGLHGVDPANTVILGAGNAGLGALALAAGLGSNVKILDIDEKKFEEIKKLYGKNVETIYSNEENIKAALKDADLVISTVLLPGAAAPKIIKREYYKDMKEGTVIVDVAIDQGGSTEVSKRTTHSNPVYVIDGIIHYSVANMPSAANRTATLALNNATLEYGLELVKNLAKDPSKLSKPLYRGINTYNGMCTNKQVAETFNIKFSEL